MMLINISINAEKGKSQKIRRTNKRASKNSKVDWKDGVKWLMAKDFSVPFMFPQFNGENPRWYQFSAPQLYFPLNLPEIDYSCKTPLYNCFVTVITGLARISKLKLSSAKRCNRHSLSIYFRYSLNNLRYTYNAFQVEIWVFYGEGWLTLLRMRHIMSLFKIYYNRRKDNDNDNDRRDKNNGNKGNSKKCRKLKGSAEKNSWKFSCEEKGKWTRIGDVAVDECMYATKVISINHAIGWRDAIWSPITHLLPFRSIYLSSGNQLDSEVSLRSAVWRQSLLILIQSCFGSDFLPGKIFLQPYRQWRPKFQYIESLCTLHSPVIRCIF